MKPLHVAIAMGIAALGGGLAVLGEFDDSPGATLLGTLVVLATMGFAVRAARRGA